MLRDPLAAPQRSKHEDDTGDGRLRDATRTDVSHPHAHQQRDWNGGRDGEQAPRAVAKRIDDDQRQHRKQDDHDREDRDHRRETRGRIDLLFRHLSERLAVASHRRGEDDEVLHGAAEHDAGNEPQGAWQEPELRGECRTDQRPGARDRREMMAVEDPARGRNEVTTVGQSLGRRGPARIQCKHAIRNEACVEAIRDGIGADAGDNQPGRADRLPTGERYHAERDRSGYGNADPHDNAGYARHRQLRRFTLLTSRCSVRVQVRRALARGTNIEHRTVKPEPSTELEHEPRSQNGEV
jgi:hypothetical protein